MSRQPEPAVERLQPPLESFKPTIYKHWSNKDAMCLEAIAKVHGLKAKRH